MVDPVGSNIHISCDRYTVQRENGEYGMRMPGRYLVCGKSHFQGVQIFPDGTASLTCTHRTADNVIVESEVLDAMRWECVFRIVRAMSDENPSTCSDTYRDYLGGSVPCLLLDHPLLCTIM